MQYRTLGKTGLQVSALGLGASPFGGVFGAVSDEQCKNCLDRALDLGINFIDCSPYYGLTKAETVLGKALRGVPREQYVLATKVGRYGEREFDFSAARVTRSVDESLARLGMEYVDLIQCHDIEFGDLKQIVAETIPALRRTVEAGKARFVGITGLPLKVFETVASQVEVDAILSYCRYTLNDTSLETLLPFLQQKNIGVISAAPLAMGLLTERGAPEWHPAPLEIKDACARAAAHCKARGSDIAKLAVQYSVSNPTIATTLVGAAQAAMIEKNARWIEEPIDEELLGEVLAILAPIRNRSWPSGRAENGDD
jgi:L-galactose dehydrogenase